MLRRLDRQAREIVSDCHGLEIRYNRSDARRELLRRGEMARDAVVQHMAEHPGLEHILEGLREDMGKAFACLLEELPAPQAPD